MVDTAIVVEALVKRFGDLTAVDGISFEVPAGMVFGLLGPNGAGKTTCIRVLATILKPDAGRALVLGHDVVREAPAVRYRIGLAGQNAAVDPNLTGRENLRMIGRLTHIPSRQVIPRADELLERFDLTDAASRPVRTYSGGMRRRLDVAAALVHRPPLLLLDEPTTGLDLRSRNELWSMIRELVAEGSTVLLTTQYLEEADRLADHIVVVDHGHVIASDTPKALKSRLGSTVIELALASDSQAKKAAVLVTGFVDEDPEIQGTTLRIVSSGPRVLIDILRSLDSEGVIPVGLAVREPSLDDVFLRLTGRHVEAEDAADLQPAEK